MTVCGACRSFNECWNHSLSDASLPVLTQATDTEGCKSYNDNAGAQTHEKSKLPAVNSKWDLHEGDVVVSARDGAKVRVIDIRRKRLVGEYVDGEHKDGKHGKRWAFQISQFIGQPILHKAPQKTQTPVPVVVLVRGDIIVVKQRKNYSILVYEDQNPRTLQCVCPFTGQRWRVHPSLLVKRIPKAAFDLAALKVK
jgi:hypothetical protein